MNSADLLGKHITFFFRDYLLCQRGASPHTVHSYRDTVKLLLRFVARRTGRSICDLVLDDFDADAVLAFLDHLESERHCGAGTRNLRLAAVRSFFRIVAANEPAAFERCQRILAIPKKRTLNKPIDYLERDEIEAILAAIERSSYAGRRDYALIAVVYNCGSRIQETLNLNACDVSLARPAHVRFLGKGKKERVCPLWAETVTVLREFLAERGLGPTSNAAIFVSARGRRLSRSGAAYILAKHVGGAVERVPSLGSKRIHPHSIRHTTAMHMLRSGVDRNAIADFLGHAHSSTTERYAHADIEMKRKALEACAPIPETATPRWRTPELMEFLEHL